MLPKVHVALLVNSGPKGFVKHYRSYRLRISPRPPENLRSAVLRDQSKHLVMGATKGVQQRGGCIESMTPTTEGSKRKRPEEPQDEGKRTIRKVLCFDVGMEPAAMADGGAAVAEVEDDSPSRPISAITPPRPQLSIVLPGEDVDEAVDEAEAPVAVDENEAPVPPVTPVPSPCLRTPRTRRGFGEAPCLRTPRTRRGFISARLLAAHQRSLTAVRAAEKDLAQRLGLSPAGARWLVQYRTARGLQRRWRDLVAARHKLRLAETGARTRAFRAAARRLQRSYRTLIRAHVLRGLVSARHELRLAAACELQRLWGKLRAARRWRKLVSWRHLVTPLSETSLRASDCSRVGEEVRLTFPLIPTPALTLALAHHSLASTSPAPSPSTLTRSSPLPRASTARSSSRPPNGGPA